MKNMMEYKGYYANIEYSNKNKCLVGTIVGIPEIISFEDDNIERLEKTFIDAVEDYLVFCAKLRKEPYKTHKGSFNVRIDPDLHREAAIIAMANGISLNKLIEMAVRSYVRG